jgi:hypothetical protein
LENCNETMKIDWKSIEKNNIAAKF